jgi:antitoxin component of MazEF toxin-antitoxin module
MIKQLKKVGNGNALFLDRAILELLGLEEGGEVQLTVHDRVLLVAPANPRVASEDRFRAALDRVVAERREVLRRLAE